MPVFTPFDLVGTLGTLNTQARCISATDTRDSRKIDGRQPAEERNAPAELPPGALAPSSMLGSPTLKVGARGSSPIFLCLWRCADPFKSAWSLTVCIYLPITQGVCKRPQVLCPGAISCFTVRELPLLSGRCLGPEWLQRVVVSPDGCLLPTITKQCRQWIRPLPRANFAPTCLTNVAVLCCLQCDRRTQNYTRWDANTIPTISKKGYFCLTFRYDAANACVGPCCSYTLGKIQLDSCKFAT